ncbi:MFS transporter [Gemmatimonadetes bacterium T265]|nr:MFS transporter [Gemmatimonadetes bacterium T265]
MPPLLARLGLRTPALRAWALYDVGVAGVFIIVVTAVFPIYFARVAAAGLPPGVASARFSLGSAAALLLAVVLSPLLGAVADARPLKKRVLAVSMAVGALASAALGLVGRGDWAFALVAFGVLNVAVNGSQVAYDALLPHIARPDELDRASTAAYGVHYLGGGLVLLAALFVIQHPAAVGLGAPAARDGTLPTRLVFVAVALWWALFAVPLLRRVPEPPPAPRAPGAPEPTLGQAAAGAFATLAGTVRTLRALPNTGRFLLAFILYNDGVNTIIRLAAVYGAELRLRDSALIVAIVMVQFVGIPFAFAFGALADRVGAKRAVLGAIAVYGVISAVAYGMKTERDFFLLAALVATVQGGAQALSRSLYASLTPASRSGEYFALFSVFSRFGGLIGQTAFFVITTLTGSSRLGILSVVVLFAGGAALLAPVDLARGRADARALDAGPGAAAAV